MSTTLIVQVLTALDQRPLGRSTDDVAIRRLSESRHSSRSGPGFPGGIGVLMGYLSRTQSDRTKIRFVDSGGTPGPVPTRLRKFAQALFACLGPVPDDTVFHFNQASKISTWRKLVLVYALRMRSRPYVLHVHGGRFDAFLEGLNPVARRMVSDMFSKAAGIIVLGEYWRDYIAEFLGVPPEKFYVVPNAVPGPREVRRIGRLRWSCSVAS